MADLIPSNDEQQEMAKQVEAIAEAAAQRDSQIAQMLNLAPKAAALSTAASRAINFTKKTWVDDPTSGTPITAADMNRLEQAIVDLNTTLDSVQNSLSQTSRVSVEGVSAMVGSTRVDCYAWLLGNLDLLCVVIPVSQVGASVSWSPGSGGMMVSDAIVISLPSDYVCDQGICFGGSRNSNALPSNWVFNGSKISLNLVSINTKQPYQVASIFSLRQQS